MGMEPKSGAVEQNDEKKKINDDLVVYMRKHSDTEAPRYTARLKTYVDFQQKRRRAANARRHSDHHPQDTKASSVARKKTDPNDKDKSNCDNSEHPGSEDGRVSRRRRVASDEKGVRRSSRSFSRSRSEPSDRCGRRRRRRRRRCGRRRRRRSCRRRRRSRRRRRRSCRRRRRRSCSRRRRRRSCRRRRRRRRRC